MVKLLSIVPLLFLGCGVSDVPSLPKVGSAGVGPIIPPISTGPTMTMFSITLRAYPGADAVHPMQADAILRIPAFIRGAEVAPSGYRATVWIGTGVICQYESNGGGKRTYGLLGCNGSNLPGDYITLRTGEFLQLHIDTGLIPVDAVLEGTIAQGS
jgi:hypothetical protein